MSMQSGGLDYQATDLDLAEAITCTVSYSLWAYELGDLESRPTAAGFGDSLHGQLGGLKSQAADFGCENPVACPTWGHAVSDN